LRRRRMAPAKPEEEARMNRLITAPQVRLIDADSSQVGVVSTAQALARAQEQGLDLVEVSPNTDPPVCRIMDAGRQKYLRKKRESEQRRKQTRITVKEVKLRPKTDDHDFMTKANSAHAFLEGGDKVKITIMFRGREMSHPEIARAHLDRMIEVMGDDAVLEQVARMEGRNMFVILAPSPAVLKARQAQRVEKERTDREAKKTTQAAARAAKAALAAAAEAGEAEEDPSAEPAEAGEAVEDPGAESAESAEAGEAEEDPGAESAEAGEAEEDPGAESAEAGEAEGDPVAEAAEATQDVKAADGEATEEAAKAADVEAVAAE
jgi:translation initiation factor IF-3